MDMKDKANQIIKETEIKENSFKEVSGFYKSLYDSLVESGFADMQALFIITELVKAHLKPS